MPVLKKDLALLCTCKVFRLALACCLLYAPMPKAFAVAACSIELHSLSRTSGRPGDVFEMKGKWGKSQGKNIPCINHGKMNRLEIQEWGPAVIKVRIPQGLAPGDYKVGVYCGDLSKEQAVGGTQWLDFRIEKPKSHPEPVTVTGQIARPGEEPAASSPRSNFWGFTAVLTVIIAIWVLRRRRARSTAGPDKLSPAPAPVAEGRVYFTLDTADGREYWSGQANGTSYDVALYSEESATIEIALDRPLGKPLEVNARAPGLPPDLGQDPRRPELQALLDLGANYLDIGFNTDRVAAEFPCAKFAARDVSIIAGRRVRKVSLTGEFAAQVVERLVRLRDLSC